MFARDAVRDAIANRNMFQLFDTQEALKLDIYPRELIPNELERSVEQEVFEGETIPVVSCADAAVSKLIWVSKGSSKGRRDFRQIFRLASEANRQQITQFAEQLGLVDLQHELLQERDDIS